MRITTRWTAAAALLALGTAAPACGQTTRMRSHSEIVEDGVHRDIDVDGEVRFSDDDAGIEYLSPGGRVTIEERVSGAPDRRLEYRGTDGGISTRFFRDDRETTPDEADRAWIRRALLEMVRESGANAERRVARIYARGGGDAVLEETRHIASDGVKRMYFSALLRQPLRDDEAARALHEAGERIASDGDKRMVLLEGLRVRPGDPRVLEAALEAAARIASDGDKAAVLISAADGDPLADAGVREAFFRAARSIASDGDKARVLMAALTRGGARRDAVLGALRVAAGIASDGDKARVLMSVPGEALRDRAVMDAFQDDVRGIASDGDKSRVLQWLAARVR